MSEREGVSLGNTIRDIAHKWLGSMRAMIVLATLGLSVPLGAQQVATSKPVPSAVDAQSSDAETSQDYNQRIAQLLRSTGGGVANSSMGDYQIGPEDLLEISVLEAPDLSRTVRVSDDGAISLPLLGSIQAAGLSTREMETVLEDLLRQTYMKDPQVSVFVQEMRSHPVSVFGAVEKPGVYQIRDAKTLVEVLSMAQGLADDAGDSVIIVRHGGQSSDLVEGSSPHSDSTVTADPPREAGASGQGGAGQATDEVSSPESITVNLKDLLDSGNPSANVLVYPGDAVKVTRAGIVYVVGEVHKPGGFVLKTNENISVLQAIALAEGITSTSNRKQTRIILAGERNGSREEIPINLDKILAGKAPDPLLKPNDILFVPTSSSKAALHGFAQSTAMVVASVGGAAVYRW
jgi:polysaccharide biosynthesis/export protein